MSRRSQIDDLIREELRENGDLEDDEIVTSWMILIATHAEEDNGSSFTGHVQIDSDPEPASLVGIGLAQNFLMREQVIASAAAFKALGGDDDD